MTTLQENTNTELKPPPHDILETRNDKVRLIRRYADSGMIPEHVLDEMIQGVRDYEKEHGLTECVIYNRQSY